MSERAWWARRVEAARPRAARDSMVLSREREAAVCMGERSGGRQVRPESARWLEAVSADGGGWQCLPRRGRRWEILLRGIAAGKGKEGVGAAAHTF